jgi:hypothetical protein
MSVTILPSDKALTVIDDSKCTGPSVTANFFNVFGTTNCLLNCKDERILDLQLYGEKTKQGAKTRREKKKITYEHKLQLNEFRESRQDWFTATTIKRSASQGCGSCSILQKIIIAIFFHESNCLPDQYEYSIAQDFEIRYRNVGKDETIATVQLFQPPGKYITLNNEGI